jgi:hypothetical protein
VAIYAQAAARFRISKNKKGVGPVPGRRSTSKVAYVANGKERKKATGLGIKKLLVLRRRSRPAPEASKFGWEKGRHVSSHVCRNRRRVGVLRRRGRPAPEASKFG